MVKGWKIYVPLLCVIALVGCSDPGPLRFPVEGTVLLDGKPYPHKGLDFWPIDGTNGQGAGGCTDADGKFTLQAIVPGALRDYKGCPPGKYVVVVNEPAFPVAAEKELTQEELQGEVVGDQGPVAAIALSTPKRSRRAKGSIPMIYTSAKTSPLVVEVTEDNHVFELALESKPSRSLSSVQYQRRN